MSTVCEEYDVHVLDDVSVFLNMQATACHACCILFCGQDSRESQHCTVVLRICPVQSAALLTGLSITPPFWQCITMRPRHKRCGGLIDGTSAALGAGNPSRSCQAACHDGKEVVPRLAAMPCGMCVGMCYNSMSSVTLQCVHVLSSCGTYLPYIWHSRECLGCFQTLL